MLFRIAAIKYQTEYGRTMNIMELWSSYRRGADPEEIFSLYQECPLHEKAEGYGDVNLLHIASQNAHPEAENDMLETAYKLAMRQGADVNLVNNSQHSALYYATENGFTEIVEQLLMAGAEG